MQRLEKSALLAELEEVERLMDAAELRMDATEAALAKLSPEFAQYRRVTEARVTTRQRPRRQQQKKQKHKQKHKQKQ